MHDHLDRALEGVREQTANRLPPREVMGRERRGEMRLADHGEVRILWIDEDEQVHTEPARLRDSTSKGAGLYTDRQFPVNQSVWLDGIEEGMRKAVVRYSRHIRMDRWKTGFLYLDNERRRMSRVKAEGTGWLSWTEGIRPAGSPVRVLDISELGACVEIENAVPREVMVKLRGEAMECMAAIRYRRRTGEKMLLGLQFVCRPYDRNDARRAAGRDDAKE